MIIEEGEVRDDNDVVTPVVEAVIRGYFHMYLYVYLWINTWWFYSKKNNAHKFVLKVTYISTTEFKS
jgi:hypothetical protein